MSKHIRLPSGKLPRAYRSRFTNVIEGNAAELRTLEEEVHRTRKQLGRGQEWSDASGRFFAAFDRLAFPGGLAKAIDLLPKCDLNTIESAVRFLEVDPWFFRSGYIKADLLRHLRRVPLTEDQKLRLQKVVIARVLGEDRREFKYYCRLARLISDQNFEQALNELPSSPVEHVSRHARWVLEQLRAASKSR
jgi:hypothetical protein